MSESISQEVIYQAYPRHVGRRDAIRTIDNALKRLRTSEVGLIPKDFWKSADGLTTASFLLDRAQIFAHSPAGQRGMMTPHPSTWFNQSRYLDDIAEWYLSSQPYYDHKPTLAERNKNALSKVFGRTVE